MARYMQWLLSASRPTPAGVLSASSLHTFLEPAHAMRDGLSAYGFGTFENYYRDGYWVHTKGGLSSGVASFLAVAPDLGLGAFNTFNVESGSLPDAGVAAVFSTLVPALRAAANTHWASACDRFPSNANLALGKYGAEFELQPPAKCASVCTNAAYREPPCASCISASCELVAVQSGTTTPLVAYAAPDLIASGAPPVKLPLSAGFDVVFAFRYAPAPLSPSMSVAALSEGTCLTESGLNEHAIGYVLEGTAGGTVPAAVGKLFMFLPNQMSAQYFPQL